MLVMLDKNADARDKDAMINAKDPEAGWLGHDASCWMAEGG